MCRIRSVIYEHGEKQTWWVADGSGGVPAHAIIQKWIFPSDIYLSTSIFMVGWIWRIHRQYKNFPYEIYISLN